MCAQIIPWKNQLVSSYIQFEYVTSKTKKLSNHNEHFLKYNTLIFSLFYNNTKVEQKELYIISNFKTIKKFAKNLSYIILLFILILNSLDLIIKLFNNFILYNSYKYYKKI